MLVYNPYTKQSQDSHTVRFHSVLVRLALLLGILGASCGFYAAVRVGWSDWVRRTNTDEAIRAAIALTPSNWKYYRDLAEFNPPQAILPLRHAIQLNPANSSLRIELGEYAEQIGDFAAAEEGYRSAVAIDQTYAPRFEQAEFYFRRHDSGRFASAAKSAFAVGFHEDMTILFSQCWELFDDADQIFTRMIPTRPEALQQYLAFLLNSGRIGAAPPVAKRLMSAEVDVADNREVILRYCDRMLDAGDYSDALEAWNWLAGRALVSFPPIAQDDLVTNGEFVKPPLKRGFDWRYGDTHGMYFESIPAGGLKISLTSKQPEHCVTLWQYIPLPEPGKYRLDVKYRTPGKDSGLNWQVLAGGKDLLRGGGALSVPSRPASALAEQEFEFAAPAAGLAQLRLGYVRVLGTVRVEGDAEIREVRLRRE